MAFAQTENKVPRGYIEEDDPQVSRFGHPAPPWLVNYADLMTEMVCFFIILYALSAVLSKNIQQAKKEIDRIIEEEQLQADVKITKEGIRLTLEDQGGADSFFKIGKADLTPKMVHLMMKIGPLLKNMPNEVLIEGHTDNVPIDTDRFPSNWELSSARALTVLHHLIEEHQLDPRRVSAIGYGEFRPRAPNDTPENRARNRRVVFFIKNVPPKFDDEAKSDKEKAVAKADGQASAKPAVTEHPSGHAPAVKVTTDSSGLVPVKQLDQVQADMDKTFPRTPAVEEPKFP